LLGSEIARALSLPRDSARAIAAERIRIHLNG